MQVFSGFLVSMEGGSIRWKMMNRISEHIKTVLLVVLVTLTMTFGAMSWRNSKALETARADVVELTGKAKTLERDIKDIRTQQAQFAKNLSLYNKKQQDLSKKQESLKEELRNVSTESKAYLDTPIPSDVGRVLDSIFD